MPSWNEVKTHRLINKERKKNRLPPLKWSPSMYKLAKPLAKKMARVGRLIHSGRYALQGGENVSGGYGNHKPRDFVRSWMTSPAHRAWLLSSEVKSAAVGVARSRKGTYVAWSFSDKIPFKIHITEISLFKYLRTVNMNARFRNLFFGTLRLVCKLVSLSFIIFGAHGLWVHFSPMEMLFNWESASKLFLIIKIPVEFSALRDLIVWISIKGFQSWFIPALFVIAGIILWHYLTEVINWASRNV